MTKEIRNIGEIIGEIEWIDRDSSFSRAWATIGRKGAEIRVGRVARICGEGEQMKKWKLNPALPEVPVEGTVIFAGTIGSLHRIDGKWLWEDGTESSWNKWPQWNQGITRDAYTVYPASVPLYVEEEPKPVELRSLSEGKRFVTASGGVDGVVNNAGAVMIDGQAGYAIECRVGDEFRYFSPTTLVWPVEDGK